MKRVSIVVPCRNEERHLAAFAASALAQRLPAAGRSRS
jgi:glycosyltransferase involved in cell wall biosynthesis